MLRKAILIFVGIILASCGFSSEEVRYRLTVEVDTPDGLKSGSSVMGFKISPGFPQSYSPSFRGEAVAVDLGSRGILFLTLTSRVAMFPENVFRRTGLFASLPKDEQNDRISLLNFLADQPGTKAALECAPPYYDAECPSFVRFRDISNPMSVEKVDRKHLAASFGPGVHLKRVSIEITDDDVTEGIQKKLLWLDRLEGNYLHGGSTSVGAPLGLNVNDFMSTI